MSWEKKAWQKPDLKHFSSFHCQGENSDETDVKSKAKRGCFEDSLLVDSAPARSFLFGDSACQLRVKKFCLRDNNPSSWSAIQSNFKRKTPLLQDPAETFSKINNLAHQTLKYVKEVESIDFSSRHVIDFNGEVMQDPLRVFLSVCTSVLANFFFCSQIDLDKLLKFLSSLFEGYSTDNAYHNALHAADSLQMLFLMLREKPATLIFTDDDVIIAFLATLCVSYVHPGVTNAFLASIDHPLVLVYGDMSTQQSASLTAFLYLLNREENRFVDLSANSGSQPYSQFLRELLVETTLGTAPRTRWFLLRRLQLVAESNSVEIDDIPALLTAVVILADNALVLRPRPRFIVSAAFLLAEWLCEAHEREKRGMDLFLPGFCDHARENGLAMVADHFKAWLRPLVMAVHALVPQDLCDNMERNVEAPSMTEAAEFEIPQDLQDERWSDGSVPVIEIIRKVTLHASSLDRKASKWAILNASSNWKLSAVSSQVSSPHYAERETRLPRVASDRGVSGNQPGRCEHYFSFLRLYDTYEKEGRSLDEFAAQLVFLALQLNPEYIGRYTREGVDVCSKEECLQIAKLIMEKEQAPTTAEVIVLPARPGQQTDSFILRLMEMYAERAGEKYKNGTPNNSSFFVGNNLRRPLQCYNPVYGGGSFSKK